MTLNPLDYLLLALLLYSAIRAALNGLFREAFTLAGLLLGFPLACWYYAPLAAQLRNLISTPTLAQLAAFALIGFTTMHCLHNADKEVAATYAANNAAMHTAENASAAPQASLQAPFTISYQMAAEPNRNPNF